jgi:hypothetical protein
MAAVLCAKGCLYVLMAADLASWDLGGQEIASKVGGYALYDAVVGAVSLLLSAVLFWGRHREPAAAAQVLMVVTAGLVMLLGYGVVTRLGSTSSPSAEALAVTAVLVALGAVASRRAL